MADISFIKIYPNLAVAQQLGDSPQANIHYSSQVQLKPLDIKPYNIVSSGNVNLKVDAGYSVFLVFCKDLTEVEITPNAQITNFTENGIVQLKIRLAYLPNDYGKDVVYLKIVPVYVVSPYYSSRFIITDTDIELTTRIDYIDRARNIPANEVNNTIGFIQSIRLRFYFDNPVSKAEVENYYQITRGQNVNPRILKGELKQWKTQLFNRYTFERLARAMYTGICYFDQIRNYPMGGLEYEQRLGDTNISEMEFITDPDESDYLTIASVIITTLRDFTINHALPNVLINDPREFLVTTTQIPTT